MNKVIGFKFCRRIKLRLPFPHAETNDNNEEKNAAQKMQKC